LDRGDLHLPIHTGDPDFPIVQYADDTLLILPADHIQLAALKSLLVNFTATRLAVNFDKSCMLPINVTDEEIQQLAYDFGCIVGTFPFTYLGLPMGTTRPSIQDISPLVCKIERKLTKSMNLLAYGGRLQLIQSCLQSMPIFFLCSLHISPGIIKPINRIIRHGLWGKKEDGNGKQSLASWDMICIPKSAGGLGIMDFGKQNDALLIKQLHKFYNKAEVPWVQLVWQYYIDEVPHVAKLCGSFWWRDIMKLAEKYREICTVTRVNGDSILFWSDKWRGNALSQDYPILFSFVLDKSVSLKEMVALENIEDHFYLPLSAQAFDEFNQVKQIILNQHLNPNGKYIWLTLWKDGIYTANKFYHYTFRDQKASPI
jgi:hypothetical protein